MSLLNPKHNSNETAQTIRIYTIAMGYVKGEFSPGNSIVYRLWERQRYLESHQEFDLLLQAKLRVPQCRRMVNRANQSLKVVWLFSTIIAL
jgi:hypothetical protein